MLHTEVAVISAAGLGSRLGLNLPKCLVKLGGKTLIQRQLELLTSFKRVFIVVGFKEEEVMAEALKYRQNIIFVRNPDFATTTNTYSLSLAAKYILGKYLAIDGDVVIEPNDFSIFRQTDFFSKSVVCIKPAESEDCIYVTLSNDKRSVTGFSQFEESEFEWTGVALINGIEINPEVAGFLYRVLERNLPLTKYVLETYEIDTPGDLAGAEAFLARKQF